MNETQQQCLTVLLLRIQAMSEEWAAEDRKQAYHSLKAALARLSPEECLEEIAQKYNIVSTTESLEMLAKSGDILANRKN